MASQPCSQCGQLRIVSRNSRTEITCQSCRRIQRAQDGCTGDDQRALNRYYQVRHRVKVRTNPVAKTKPAAITSTCEVCGQSFTGRRTLCDAHRWHHKGHRKRARKYGVQYEYINPRTIYERDHWQCGICGQPVDPRLTYPHRMSASLDHVVPMSLGGDHLTTNVQCAHLKCNMDKGARCSTW